MAAIGDACHLSDKVLTFSRSRLDHGANWTSLRANLFRIESFVDIFAARKHSAMKDYVFRLRNPEAAAAVIAELVGGEALPLPPLSDAWIVLTPDGQGLELYHDTLNRNADDAHPFSDENRKIAVVIASSLSPARLATLASGAGWPVRSRPGAGGEVVEIAIEGRQLLAIAAESLATRPDTVSAVLGGTDGTWRH